MLTSRFKYVCNTKHKVQHSQSNGNQVPSDIHKQKLPQKDTK